MGQLLWVSMGYLAVWPPQLTLPQVCTDQIVILSPQWVFLESFSSVPLDSGLLGPVFSQGHLSSGRGCEPQKWQSAESEKVLLVPVAILSQDSFSGASVNLIRPLRDDL